MLPWAARLNLYGAGLPGHEHIGAQCGILRVCFKPVMKMAR